MRERYKEKLQIHRSDRRDPVGYLVTQDNKISKKKFWYCERNNMTVVVPRRILELHYTSQAAEYADVITIQEFIEEYDNARGEGILVPAVT
jgi:hypothetical protein